MNRLKNILKNKKQNVVSVMAVVMVLGVMLMCASKGAEKKVEDVSVVENNAEDVEDTEKKLENILSLINGVGDVKVMITYRYGKEIITAEDISEDYSSEESTDKKTEKRTTETKTVMTSKNEPVVLKERYPSIEGVLIVAQGGDNPDVKNALISAAQALLDVEVHKIEVLRMKQGG